MRKYDVFGMGNALVDCVCLVTDRFLIDNKIEKGLMTLVEKDKQKTIIDKIKNSNPFIQSGGSVTNSVYTLSQLGGSSFLSFLISDDEYGNLFLDDIRKSNVFTADKNYYFGPGMTGSCLVLTTPDAERTMNTCLAVSSNYSIDNVSFEDLSLSKYLYIEGYLVTSDKAVDAIEKSISYCRENDECCKNLLNISEMVVITDGKKGSLILTENKKIKIKPHKVNAIDTVGAGDTYAGAFLYGINNGMSLEQSGNLASLLSSKVVTKLGPRLEKDIIDDIKLSIG